jgi:hypothetical protein
MKPTNGKACLYTVFEAAITTKEKEEKNIAE